jgi:hypothetical protein
MKTGISVALMWNVALKDIDALAGLKEINGDLVINGNKALTSLRPLQHVWSFHIIQILHT